MSIAPRYNAEFLEQLYHQWQTDRRSVDPEWNAFFEGFELGTVAPPDIEAKAGVTTTPAPALPAASTAPAPTGEAAGAVLPGHIQTNVDNLIRAYRTLGHISAHVDPLAKATVNHPALALDQFGFTEADLSMRVASHTWRDGASSTLGELLADLKRIYCSTIGVEYMYIENMEVREWVRTRMEQRINAPALDNATRRRMLEQVLAVETFENFLHTHFVGQKRFSIEGGEGLMVALNTMLEASPELGVEEICMGMAHRGRLSVLVEFLQMPLRKIFAKFSENFIPDTVGGDGDVKYHLGYVKDRHVGDKVVEVRLAANPSHLEAVNPVVLGMTRARQRIRMDTETRSKVVPVLVHGDAALAGQGVVVEVLNMSQLEGYQVGGTVHIVANNQIGFTTMPKDSRTSRYCTDIAKSIDAPVLHVNGDDPAAVRFASELALEFRQVFKSDVFVDIVCYRRYGHNEGDEPVFTSPTLYADIGKQKSLGTQMREQALKDGVLTQAESEKLNQQLHDRFDVVYQELRKAEQGRTLSQFEGSSAVFQPGYIYTPADTRVSYERVEQIMKALTTVPEGFNLVPKLKRAILDRRWQAWQTKGPFDWGTGEALAIGSLLLEGSPVRLSGQDSRRGTFSHRHSVLFDTQTLEGYCPLNHLGAPQAKFCVYNSPLSEASVLGFDYGYSLNFPEMLCMWEAQFGDFANGAQVIIDQFISSAESKWQRPSGIVLLLPHGYEGQGPEHSSARLERFLQLCAEENIQVANCTTPAQYFHILRRQIKREYRKPLVLMTPKSLLRHEAATSMLTDFVDGHFKDVILDPELLPEDKSKVRRVVFCSGKFYYDLAACRRDNKIANSAIVRVEQLFPVAMDALATVRAEYPNAQIFVWAQEEPMNMGAWNFITWRLREVLNRPVLYVGRGPKASTAEGLLGVHVQQQKMIAEEAFSRTEPGKY